MYCNRHNHMSALISAGYSIISFIFVLFYSNFFTNGQMLLDQKHQKRTTNLCKTLAILSTVCWKFSMNNLLGHFIVITIVSQFVKLWLTTLNYSEWLGICQIHIGSTIEVGKWNNWRCFRYICTYLEHDIIQVRQAKWRSIFKVHIKSTKQVSRA